jgi:hypothetical protein
MRSWTKDERARQAQLIHQWKPWEKAGVRTPEGKDISRLNAYKHGAYSAATQADRKAMADQLRLLKALSSSLETSQ